MSAYDSALDVCVGRHPYNYSLHDNHRLSDIPQGKKRLNLESEIGDVQKKIDHGLGRTFSARANFDLAVQIMAILESTQAASQTVSRYRPVVSNHLLTAIIDMTQAATGANLPDDQWKKCEALKTSFDSGQIAVFDSLNKLYESKVSEVVNRNHSLIAQLQELKALKSGLELTVEKFRYWAITLQIIGLIVVLMKDLIASPVTK